MKKLGVDKWLMVATIFVLLISIFIFHIPTDKNLSVLESRFDQRQDKSRPLSNDKDMIQIPASEFKAILKKLETAEKDRRIADQQLLEEMNRRIREAPIDPRTADRLRRDLEYDIDKRFKKMEAEMNTELDKTKALLNETLKALGYGIK